MTACVVVFAAMLVTFPGVGPELPADQGFQGLPGPAAERSFESGGAPVWERLAELSSFEKSNAEINLADEDELAREIESLWNSGQFDEALDLFPVLGPLDVGINRRVCREICTIRSSSDSSAGAEASLAPELSAARFSCRFRSACSLNFLRASRVCAMYSQRTSIPLKKKTASTRSSV